MPYKTVIPFRLCAILPVAALLVLCCLGCRNQTSRPTISWEKLTQLPSDAELERQLDEVLQWTLKNRRLNTRDHAAWQVLHGVLAYQRDFQVEHHGKLVSAVEHLTNGGYLQDWTVEPGMMLDKKPNRRGFRAVMAPGSGPGQGHHDH